MVDWPLKALKDFPILQSLDYIVTCVCPMDLPMTGPLFQAVSKRIDALCKEDREVVLGKVVIEVTDGELPLDHLDLALEAWKNLGFRLRYDAHVPAALEPIVRHFSFLKVNIDWAGLAIFLSHPSYNMSSAMKAEILCHAHDNDLVYIPQKPGLENTDISHSAVLGEFANWATAMITCGKPICIELHVNQNDENNAFALTKLKDLGLDIFGAHRASFLFQGGPTGVKAFQPDVFAMGAFNESGDI